MPHPIRARRTGGAPAFNPASYGGGTLKGWFKADSLTLADGASVATWTDSSSNGNNASGGTSPVYKVGVQNGKPGVLFTRASSQYLTANGLAAVQNGTDLPFTVILAAKQTALASTETFCAWGRLASGNPFSTFDAATANLQNQRRDDAALAKTPSSTGAADTNANVLSLTFTGTTAAMFKNGATLTMAASDGDIGAMTIDQFAIGALNRNTVSNFLDAHIFELLVYASALSSSDRMAIERALGAKWGITVA